MFSIFNRSLRRRFRLARIREFVRIHERTIAFLHSPKGILDEEDMIAMDREPASAQYKNKMNERRRILLQEDEDDDTEVVFWDEHTRPEDLFEGQDLEDFYTARRMHIMKDSSSTDTSQLKQFHDLSKILEIEPSDVPGYKTFFQKGEAFTNGLPGNVESAFTYFDSLIHDHPELQQAFDEWNANVEKATKLDKSKLSREMFAKLVKCPDVIMQYVDPAHKHLFEIKRSSNAFARPSTTTTTQRQSKSSSSSSSASSPSPSTTTNSIPNQSGNVCR